MSYVVTQRQGLLTNAIQSETLLGPALRVVVYTDS